MPDLQCRKCNEPWDAYGITFDKGLGDLTFEEVERFLKGEGCPSCEWGTVCVRCHGVGIEENGCPTCHGSGKVLLHKCGDYLEGAWWFGYAASQYSPSTITVFEGSPYREIAGHLCRDGWVREGWGICPTCKAKGEPCFSCHGDGKLHIVLSEDDEFRAIQSVLDNSDEEPIGLLEKMGVL